MRLKIYPALFEDISSGWVLIEERKSIQRAVIRIRSKETKKSIYCEALTLDENFRKKYREKTGNLIDSPEKALVINEWYRQRLGNLETQREYDLEIKHKVTIFGRLKAIMGHPQEAIRIAFWLAFISIVIGILSLAIGLLSIFL